MAVQDRLQPSLLDRLIDDEPQSQQESREKRVMSLKRLREAVLRDLAWLMNTSDLTSTEDLHDFPLVGQSVLNYGLPALAGHTVSNVDLPAIERLLKQAILNFEPRILKNTLKVRVAVADDQMNHNAMSFLIEGDLWAQPIPQRLFLKTEIDLETGSVTVTDQGGQGPG